MLTKTFLLLATSVLAAVSSPVEVRNDKNAPNAGTVQRLPPCGPNPVSACRCPVGTFYQASTTYAFYPVPAKEITRITGGFLETDWFGARPNMTSGESRTPGAKRWLYSEVPEGTAPILFIEELTRWDAYPNDGGYYLKYEVANMPVKYRKTSGGQGLLSGVWEIIDVREVNGHTYMLWDVYVCFNVLFDLQGFHESAMRNVSQILKDEGKTTGDMVGPISF